MLGVQLHTCVSSPVQSTNVRLEFSPIVPQSVLFCLWVGQNYLESRTASSTQALCLSPVHVAVNIHLLLAWLTIRPSSPLLLRVSGLKGRRQAQVCAAAWLVLSGASAGGLCFVLFFCPLRVLSTLVIGGAHRLLADSPGFI